MRGCPAFDMQSATFVVTGLCAEEVVRFGPCAPRLSARPLHASGASVGRPQGQAAFAAAPGSAPALNARLDAPTLVSPGSSLFTKPGQVYYPRWAWGGGGACLQHCYS